MRRNAAQVMRRSATQCGTMLLSDRWRNAAQCGARQPRPGVGERANPDPAFSGFLVTSLGSPRWPMHTAQLSADRQTSVAYGKSRQGRLHRARQQAAVARRTTHLAGSHDSPSGVCFSEPPPLGAGIVGVVGFSCESHSATDLEVSPYQCCTRDRLLGLQTLSGSYTESHNSLPWITRR